MTRFRHLLEGRRQALLILMAIGFLSAGCGRAKPPTSAAGRKALQTMLDGWKGGQTQEAMTKQSSIHTKDAHWSNGCKLLDYEIVTEEEVLGSNLRLRVKLHLTDTEGNDVEELATYSIATSPQTVVVRSEEM